MATQKQRLSVSSDECSTAKRLISTFLQHYHELPYVNLIDLKYSGWVSDFKLTSRDGRSIGLNLHNENDLFLLFALAVAWSRPGQWENAAYLIAHLKQAEKGNYIYWSESKNIRIEKENRSLNAALSEKEFDGITSPRKQIAFRDDIFDSFRILASNWSAIRLALSEAAESGNYQSFYTYMRNIEGLGYNNKKMMIKIPLILRELRCQGVFINIPGELCCVPDARVRKAAKDLNIKLGLTANVNTLIAVSTKIYELFGDLYDLPLFAYEDLKGFIKNK